MTQAEREQEIKAAMRTDLLAWAAGTRESAATALARYDELREFFADEEIDRMGEEVANDPETAAAVDAWCRAPDLSSAIH